MKYTGSLSNYLVWLEYAESDIFQRVLSFIDGIYPDHKRFGVDRRQLQGIVNTQDGHKHRLDALSSGEQNLLIVLVEIYRRIVPGSIVIVDELENSLHPAFQHRMAQGLLKLQREVPFQLIVTSHSEDIYNVFGAKSTLVLPAPKYV